jgi:hypothetical protein
MNQETREHITKDKAYEKAISFGEKIGIRKTYQGGNKDTTWESTLIILPVGVENPNDLWSNEREVIDSLFERMIGFFSPHCDICLLINSVCCVFFLDCFTFWRSAVTVLHPYTT